MLSAEQIEKNWEIHQKIIDRFFPEPRREKVINLYKDFEDIAILAPASYKEHFHNCFPGGYIDHVNRVIQFSLKVKAQWEELGIPIDFDNEELVFCAMFHDLGKLGTPKHPGYEKETEAWKIKRGQKYAINKDNNFMLIQDRSLYTLQQYGIILSEKEYISIKIHDGMYDDTNKPYLISWDPDSKLKTNLPYVLHQADFMAYKYEFDHWRINSN